MSTSSTPSRSAESPPALEAEPESQPRLSGRWRRPRLCDLPFSVKMWGPHAALVSRTHRGRCKKQRDGGQSAQGPPCLVCPVTNLPSCQGSRSWPLLSSLQVRVPGLILGRAVACHTQAGSGRLSMRTTCDKMCASFSHTFYKKTVCET